MDLETIRQEARAVAEELITTAQMKPGQILVVGCSSSEIHNSKLGTDSSQEIGQAPSLYLIPYSPMPSCEVRGRIIIFKQTELCKTL